MRHGRQPSPDHAFPRSDFGQWDDTGQSRGTGHRNHGPQDQFDPRAWQDGFGMNLPPYDPPPRRNTGLIVALSVGLAVVLVGGGVAGAAYYVNASGSAPAAQPSTAPSFPTTAPWQSGEPSEEPSQEPTAEPEPTAAPDESGTRFAHTEFQDWRFEFQGVRYSAKKVGGWTYDTCDPVDARGVLAGNKCQRAIQIAYTAYRGHVKAVQVMMEFPTASVARATAKKLQKQAGNSVNTRRDMTHADFAYGMIRTNPSQNYVVATVVTADRSAKAKAEDFHLYLHAYAASRLLLRDVTVTT
jgi:hypothetical protein